MEPTQFAKKHSVADQFVLAPPAIVETHSATAAEVNVLIAQNAVTTNIAIMATASIHVLDNVVWTLTVKLKIT